MDAGRPFTPEEKIDVWFTYHGESEMASGDLERYQAVRGTARILAHEILRNTPACADQTAALRKLRECVMTANAAIACKGV